MALEYVALGVLAVNVIMIIALSYAFFKRDRSKVDPLEYEMMEHEDPEKVMLMKMMSSGRKDDETMRTVMRDMIHRQHEQKAQKDEGRTLVDAYMKEHGSHDTFIQDRSKISEDIKSEIKSDLKEAIKREVRKKLNS